MGLDEYGLLCVCIPFLDVQSGAGLSPATPQPHLTPHQMRFLKNQGMNYSDQVHLICISTGWCSCSVN
ncbi:hypothetical protein OROMI_031603 [Orobanche minor]